MRFYQASCSMSCGEAMVVKEALSWLKAMGYSQILLEFDCMHMVNAIYSLHPDSSYFSTLVNDIKVLLSDMENISIVFIKKSMDQCVHHLTKAFVSLTNSNDWIDILQAFLENVLFRNLQYLQIHNYIMLDTMI